MPKNRTIEQEIRRLKVYVRIGFFLSAIIFGWLLFERYEHYEQAERYEGMMNKYLHTLVLTDSANVLQIQNSLRWAKDQDAEDSVKAKR